MHVIVEQGAQDHPGDHPVVVHDSVMAKSEVFRFILARCILPLTTLIFIVNYYSASYVYSV